MSLKRGFIGFVGCSLAIPTAALVAGYPGMVCEGLGVPYEKWMTSAETKMALYLYTVSDVVIGAFCGAFFVDGLGVSAALALGATAVHQISYVSAATAAYGFRKEHVASVITAAIAAGLALKE